MAALTNCAKDRYPSGSCCVRSTAVCACNFSERRSRVVTATVLSSSAGAVEGVSRSFARGGTSVERVVSDSGAGACEVPTAPSVSGTAAVPVFTGSTFGVSEIGLLAPGRRRAGALTPPPPQSEAPGCSDPQARRKERGSYGCCDRSTRSTTLPLRPPLRIETTRG